MKRIQKRILTITLVLSTVCFLLLGFVPAYVKHKLASPPDLERALTVLSQRFDKASILANSLIVQSKVHGFEHLFGQLSEDLGQTLEREGIALFLFRDGKLEFWSENLDISSIDKRQQPSVSLARNTWCMTHYIERGDIGALIILKVKHQYANQNQFLRNTFHPSLDFLSEYHVTSDLEEATFPVSIDFGDQTFTFGLSPKVLTLKESEEDVKALLIWLGLLFLAIALYTLFWHPAVRRYENKSIAALALLFISLRVACLYFPFLSLTPWEFFSPKIFAYTWLMPSLADFMVNALLVFGLTCYAYNNVAINKKLNKGLLGITLLLILPTLTFALLFLSDNLLSILVMNSTQTFEAYRIFNLSHYSMLGYFSISLWFASGIVLAHGAYRSLAGLSRVKVGIIWLIGLLIALFILLQFSLIPSFFGGVIGVLLIIILGIFTFEGKPITGRLIFLLASLLALYSVLHVSTMAKEKDVNTRKVLAVNLGNERDPIAEVLFPSVARSLLSDPEALELLDQFPTEEVELYKYIHDHYLSGFFKKYDFQITVCFPTSDLIIESTSEVYSCYEFFEGLITDFGLRIPGTSFFHLNNQNGRVSYLGMLEYVLHDGEEICIYLELDSKLDRELLGYPELLLEGTLIGKTLISQYSMAKYHQGNLIARSGDYNYTLKNPFPIDSIGQYTFITQDNYTHLAYSGEGNIQVVLSSPTVGLFNMTASFAWVFLVFYLTLLVWLRVARVRIAFRTSIYSFKNRIQRAMVQVLFLSLIMVAMVTIAYNIKSFERKNHDTLSEKLLSAMIEVERNLAREGVLSAEYEEYITFYLVHLSNVFYTDINIYDSTGFLIASSRPEIFDRQLLSHRMDPVAWHEMHFMNAAKLIHTEEIGLMKYISAYVPLFDHNNQRVAYLNLPYFTRQGEFMREVFTVIVALINIYALLILFTIFVGIIISNQITKPLELIRDRISKIDITKHNETIYYDDRDEIGQLVNEYNRMVGELAESAEKLAQSQRQSAWQEMAKQVAHEIKNPLTPMKLSLQHLVKARKENQPNWEQLFERFTSSLIEQIDALSSIATEFSNFAKMPTGKFEHINLNSTLDDAINLFVSYPDIKVVREGVQNSSIVLKANREQLQRVFVNLLKNAVQSIPKGRKGMISIKTEYDKEHWVVVAVKDNGNGIPPDLVPKLFTPNFTTKSGGTGLGLAIVKGIVESIGGSIWFETDYGKGSRFFVKLPVINDGEAQA